MFRRSDGGNSIAEFPSFRGEILARGKKSLRDCAVRNAHRVAAASALFAKAHHVQSLANVQGARLAVRANAVIVEHAVGDVRVLLDLTQHNAGTNGVRGSRGDEYSVARPHRDALQAIL